MSLLLEALKKAELAKQQGAGGQPPAEAAPASGQPEGGLSLEPQVSASAGQPLMTRDRLPDITQPLEIFTEDLAAPASAKDAPAASSPAAAPARPASGRPTAATETPPATGNDEAERASARQLFESKAVEYAPRRIFPIVAGVLGVVVLGVVGYFAYQVLAPRPSFYTGPPGGKAPPPVAAATAPSQPTPPAPRAASPAATPVPAVTAAPAAAAAQTAAAPVAAQPSSGPIAAPPQPTPAAGSVQRSRTTTAQATRAAGAAPGAAPSAEPSAPQAASAPRAPVRVTTSGPRIDPGVERGWEALQAGDLARASEEYNRALRANPNDRDALLGLAAIDTRTQNFERAEARYLKVLELDPRDAYANAALIGLRGGRDAQQSESRLKTLLAQQPDANLSFTLGNQYASQGRWAEAQQAYFAAFTGDPESPDYAYNVAVSLDHLRQPRLALDYYQRALKLAGNRPVGFNTAQVEARVRDLQR